MPEIKRRNGYYFYNGVHLPSVSTILKSAGSSDGLVNWACKQGGLGVIWGLSKVADMDALKERLGSPSCIEWAVEQAKIGLASEGDRVKGFGTVVHEVIEKYILGESYPVDHLSFEMSTAFNTFVDFYKDIGLSLGNSIVEQNVYSLLHRYAGRFDILHNFSSESAAKLAPYLTNSSSSPTSGLVMCDIKTGSLYPKTQGIQLSAYAQAYLETCGDKCVGGLIINIAREEPEKIKCHYFNRQDLDNHFNKGFLPAIEVWKFFDAPKWYHAQEFNAASQEQVPA